MERYAKTFTVRWSDCDVNSHMRNTAYSEYGVDIRIDFLAERGWSFDHFLSAGVGPVLLREEIDYRREVRLGEAVEVDLEVLGASADGTLFRIRHGFTKANGKQAARYVLDGGWMNMRTRRLCPPPEELLRAWGSAPRAPEWAVIPPRQHRK